ncbi:hypothetical protein BKA93DRAFT_170122 [Sparassis latifolia]
MSNSQTRFSQLLAENNAVFAASLTLTVVCSDASINFCSVHEHLTGGMAHSCHLYSRGLRLQLFHISDPCAVAIFALFNCHLFWWFHRTLGFPLPLERFPCDLSAATPAFSAFLSVHRRHCSELSFSALYSDDFHNLQVSSVLLVPSHPWLLAASCSRATHPRHRSQRKPDFRPLRRRDY